jgi:ribonuclease HI
MMACVYKIEMRGRPKKYVSICTDSHVALKALQATRASPLVQQCQTALNDTFTQHTVGLYWVPGHAGYEETKSPTSLQETVLFKSVLNRSHPWGSLGRI